MDPPHVPSRPERDDTDASLRAERAKTDAELATSRELVERDADQLMQNVRKHAQRSLDATRKTADRERRPTSSDTGDALQAERLAQDRALTDEHNAEDERLRVEREERQLALAALLGLERQSTDERLVIERAHADACIRTRDDFLGMVSHDLRTMLGGIALNVMLIAKDASAQGDHTSATLTRVERIQRFVARTNRLVGDLLDVLSLEAGRMDLTPQPDDAIRLVREAVEAFQAMFDAKGVSLTTETAADSILARYDHERILQVLANLLSNALKFTDQGGYVTLTVVPAEAEVQFSIVDTGIGIPTEQMGEIFERFHQLNRPDRRGVGLGLYISKCIVEAHGGRIWANTPAPAQGTAMHFTLPRER